MVTAMQNPCYARSGGCNRSGKTGIDSRCVLNLTHRQVATCYFVPDVDDKDIPFVDPEVSAEGP